MDFIAIDFETANRQPNSACQLAAVVVRESKIVEEHCWLIRPPRMYFSAMNIAIHGIRPEDVRNSPTMEGIWTNLAPLIDGAVVIAHNASFDIGVLVHSLAAFDIACPNLDFHCSRTLARATWPGKQSYGLKPLGNWLGIQFRHHDALEDARCCAKIALAVEQATARANCIDAAAVQEVARVTKAEPMQVEQLEATLRIRRGHYGQGIVTGPRMLPRRGAKGQGSSSRSQGGSGINDRRGFPTAPAKRQLGGIDPGCVLAAAGEQLPFAGKRIVMLGPLRGLDAEGTSELLRRLGAEVQQSVDSRTDYVVACGTSLDEAAATIRQSPLAAAETVEEYARNGAVRDDQTKSSGSKQGVRVLSERQFRMLLPAGQATVRW